MGFINRPAHSLRPLLIFFAAIFAATASAPTAFADANVVINKESGAGIIRGIVRDEGGSPISDATVAIFRSGTTRLLKQVSSATDGSFLARILPGTYTVLAVAQGFNPVTLLGVEVNRSANLSYGFKLERAGGGNTLPEKRLDRNNSKWRIRAAQQQRSIYQHQEGKEPIDGSATAGTEVDETAETTDADAKASGRRRQTVVETYFGGTKTGMYSGVNFATLVPVGDGADVVIAGQTGKGPNAPQRFEADLKFHLTDSHLIRVNSSAGRLGSVAFQNQTRSLGQVSFQGIDEWKLREGVILVLGFDYSKFVGASDDSSLSPRLGLQFDVNSKTRVRAALTTQTEEKTWAQAADLEGANVVFSDPVSVQDLVVVSGNPQMNKSRRLEFGVERILDNHSSIEANAFFDTTLGRGVGLNAVSFDTLGASGMSEFVSDQQGKSQGLRVVYTRRLDKIFTTSAGYSLGSGQKVSPNAVSDPAHVFEGDFFQSFFAQVAADMKTGTSVRTIYRLSPQATVFAIDPFKGRLAIYDPGLSIFVTQALPSLGLPIHAEAILDARNLLDFQTGVAGELGSVTLNSQGRMVRGGILVRF